MKVALFSIAAMLIGSVGTADACKVKENKSKRMARRAPPIERSTPAPEQATPAPAVTPAEAPAPAPAAEEPKPAEPAPEAKPAEPVKPVTEEAKPQPEPAPTGGGKFTSELSFGLGQDSLTPGNKKALDGVAKWLAANPTARLSIEGHADSRGTDEMNQTLSESRARSVKAYLESQGVDGGRMDVVGFGESKPKYPGASGKNRRVQLVKQ